MQKTRRGKSHEPDNELINTLIINVIHRTGERERVKSCES